MTFSTSQSLGIFLHPGKSHALNGKRDTTPFIPTWCLAVHWGKCSSIFVAVVFLCHHYFVLSSKFSRKTRHLQLNLRGVSRFWRPIFYCPNLSSHGLRTPNEGINQRNLKIWIFIYFYFFSADLPHSEWSPKSICFLIKATLTSLT